MPLREGTVASSGSMASNPRASTSILPCHCLTWSRHVRCATGATADVQAGRVCGNCSPPATVRQLGVVALYLRAVVAPTQRHQHAAIAATKCIVPDGGSNNLLAQSTCVCVWGDICSGETLARTAAAVRISAFLSRPLRAFCAIRQRSTCHHDLTICIALRNAFEILECHQMQRWLAEKSCSDLLLRHMPLSWHNAQCAH